MPKINVKHESREIAEEGYKKIKHFFETDKDLRKIDSKIQCSFQDQQLKGQFHANQFKGDFSVQAKNSPDSGCWVEINVDLPLLLTPFKGKVQDMMSKKLTKYLG